MKLGRGTYHCGARYGHGNLSLLEAIERSGAILHNFDDQGWDGYFNAVEDFQPNHWKGQAWLPKILRQVDHVIYSSGLVDLFKKDKGEKGETRVENLMELVSAAKSFEPDPAEEMSPLDEFLSHAALEAGEGQAEAWEDCVQLMTMHSAKGLEFPLVFLCGLEDGLFPHQRSIADPNGLEEERRLCYVGITRAMQTLYVTYAEQRRLHGMDNYSQPSRFIAEMPDEFVEAIRPRVQVSRPMRSRTSLHGAPLVGSRSASARRSWRSCCCSLVSG